MQVEDDKVIIEKKAIVIKMTITEFWNLKALVKHSMKEKDNWKHQIMADGALFLELGV